MKKLIELDVAIVTAIDVADEYDGGDNFERDRKIRDALMDLPTVDAVEVVRCKDCRYWRDTDHTCREHSLVSPMTAKDYCSKGERKDGERHEG